ncbi:SAM-dependent methyltransferase [Actinomadura kijaniata]|uniref:SAM-dependent methyltransferase n=1 Tax=Actinomadura kijaniata TaxID=46161 RepID=UPI003F1CA8FB
MAVTPVPERLRWAVETLRVAPDDRLLEIGCGSGVAVDLVCRRLDRGHILAVDRSETAIARAGRRNAAHVAAGRATLRAATPDRLDLPPGPRFDKVFAVNVNLFWTRSPRPELDLIRTWLKPSGALYLFYEPPDASRRAELAARVGAALADHGLETTTLTGTASRPLVCVIGR